MMRWRVAETLVEAPRPVDPVGGGGVDVHGVDELLVLEDELVGVADGDQAFAQQSAASASHATLSAAVEVATTTTSNAATTSVPQAGVQTPPLLRLLVLLVLLRLLLRLTLGEALG